MSLNYTIHLVTCLYPVSDFYAGTPRILYYALLIISLLTIRRHEWLTAVCLGYVATYAATASVHAITLVAGLSEWPEKQLVTGRGEGTAEHEHTIAVVQPAWIELDGDVTLAVCVSAYLMVVPLVCRKRHRLGLTREGEKLWSRCVLLVGWTLLVAAGAICSILV